MIIKEVVTEYIHVVTISFNLYGNSFYKEMKKGQNHAIIL